MVGFDEDAEAIVSDGTVRKARMTKVVEDSLPKFEESRGASFKATRPKIEGFEWDLRDFTPTDFFSNGSRAQSS